MNARTYLDHLDPDYLRYYLATLLGPTLADLDLDLKAFEERVNSHLVGKWVNLASRCAGFVHKYFDGTLANSVRAAEVSDYRWAISRLSHCPLFYEKRDYASAMRRVIEVADFANAYVDRMKPWLIAKDEARRPELHAVCTLAINLFRALAISLNPVIPKTVQRAEAFLAEPKPFDAFRQIEEFIVDRKLNPFESLTTRIDPNKIGAVIEASKESLKPANEASAGAAPVAAIAAPAKALDSAAAATISIDDFAKLDLRIGKVLACEFVDGSDKLLRFELDAGDLGKRQIFSGIRAAYGGPEKLIGRHVVFIANLAPRKMRFGLSEGMILCAGSGGADLFLLDVDAGAKSGMSVK